MSKRLAVLATIAGILTVHLDAQTLQGGDDVRVRITGADSFALRDAERVGGDATTDQFVMQKTGQLLTVLNPGVRAIGRALSANREAVTVLLNGRHDPIVIPMASIGKFEASVHRGKSHSVLGVLAGVGAFYGAFGLVGLTCGFDCVDSVAFSPFVAGVAAGVAVGRSHEKWKPVSMDWILSNIRAD